MSMMTADVLSAREREMESEFRSVGGRAEVLVFAAQRQGALHRELRFTEMRTRF